VDCGDGLLGEVPADAAGQRAAGRCAQTKWWMSRNRIFLRYVGRIGRQAPRGRDDLGSFQLVVAALVWSVNPPAAMTLRTQFDSVP
jgi:hypothetical protein